MATTRAARPTDFRLALPEDWFSLDLDPCSRVAAIRRLAEARARRFPELWPHVPRIASLLLQHAAASAEAGAVYAAMTAEVVDGDPFTAALTVFALPWDDEGVGEVDDRVDAAALAKGLRAHVPESQRLDGGRTVDVAELPAGPAVRLRTLHVVGTDGRGRELVADAVQWFVPIPGGRDVLLLAFATPILVAGDALAELFDAIAWSLRLEDPASDSGPA